MWSLVTDAKGTLIAFAVVLFLLLLLQNGCGKRMDKWREHRHERRQERYERWDQWREHRRERWRDRYYRRRNPRVLWTKTVS